MLAFLIVVLVLWTALHAYVAARLVGSLAGRRWVRGLAYATFVLLAVGGPLGPYAARFLVDPYADVARWASWVYIGGFTVLFALIFARDLAYWAVRLVVLENQCTGYAGYAGEQDNDPVNDTDCKTASDRGTIVHAAELQVF